MKDEPWGPVAKKLLDSYPLANLDAGQPRESLRKQLAELSEQSLFAPAAMKDVGYARCCLAGLWLWHGFLDESHEISQSIDTSAGSAWHGLMHRREGDFWNANYWFKRVGDLSLFDGAKEHFLAVENIELLSPSLAKLVEAAKWSPVRFTDEVQRVLALGQPSEIAAAVQLAAAEWRALFSACWSRALE